MPSKSYVEVGYYSNPDEVGWDGWLTFTEGTVFVRKARDGNPAHIAILKDKQVHEAGELLNLLAEFFVGEIKYLQGFHGRGDRTPPEIDE